MTKTSSHIIIILLGLLSSCGTKQKLNPPGTIYLKDNIYIDQYPVTNINYSEFLATIYGYWSLATSDSLKDFKEYGLSDKNFVIHGNIMEISAKSDKNNKLENYDINASPFYGKPDHELYKQMFPNDTIIYYDLKMRTYLSHPAYRHYPVVYVSMAQAAMYCKYRTDLVKIMRALNTKDSLEHSKRYNTIVRYRLPTTEEWILAHKNHGLSTNEYIIREDSFYIPQLLDSDYFQHKNNDNQFCVLPGSLSEITSDSMILNYNWSDSTYKEIERPREYNHPSPYIGFRCVCETE